MLSKILSPVAIGLITNAALVLSIVRTLPQVIKLHKTKSAADLSITTYVLRLLELFSFLFIYMADKKIQLILLIVYHFVLCLYEFYLVIKYKRSERRK